MFGKKNKPNAWYKTAEKLRRKRKLPDNYVSLLDYYSAITIGIGVLNGHNDFFSMAKFDEQLDDSAKNVRSLLPADLINNFNAALDKFVSLGDDPEYDDIISAFDEYDDYAAEHNGEIAAIIENYITEMKERHYI